MFRLFRCYIIGFIFASFSLLSYAAVNNISEEDGAPSVYPWKIKVPNSSLTDNGDGTASLSITGAPVGSTYITTTADATLTGEFALGTLANGILKNTTVAGVGTPSIATDGTDYLSSTTGLKLDCSNDPLTDSLEIDDTNATAVLTLKRLQAAIGSSDIVARIEANTQDTDDPGVCAKIEALSYGTAGETGWRFSTGTPSALLETMQLDPYGFLGLGTPWPDSPDRILHIQHATDPYFRITRNDLTVVDDEIVGCIEFQTLDSTAPGVAAVIQAEAETANGDASLVFKTGTGGAVTERLRLGYGGLNVGTGAWDFGGATSVEIPNGADPDVTVLGRISYDTDTFAIRGYDGANQIVIGQKDKVICFTACNPDLLTDADFVPFWTNRTGKTFNITAIYSFSDVDDADYTLKYTTNATYDFTNLTTIEAITISTNGTGVFYNELTAGIDDTTVETGKTIGYDASADDVDYIHGVIVGWLDAND